MSSFPGLFVGRDCSSSAWFACWSRPLLLSSQSKLKNSSRGVGDTPLVAVPGGKSSVNRGVYGNRKAFYPRKNCYAEDLAAHIETTSAGIDVRASGVRECHRRQWTRRFG